MDRSNSTVKDGISRRKKNFANFHYRRRSRVNCALQYSAELGSVLGLTLKSNCAFTCDSNTALLAYPAGCVIVLHNPRNGKQLFIFNPGQKTITCLKFSFDGNFIVTGESGHQPCVRVFSVSDRSQVASFPAHKYGVSCVAFSPNSKYVISIGYQHDNVINVWDWKRNVVAASNKVSTKVKSVAFSECSKYFVTVGNRHVKFWYLEKATTPDNCTVPLKGRSAILESLRNHMFCDVVCGVGSDSDLTFAITRSGLLCQFNAKRTVACHVELKSSAGRTVCIINDSILCGSGNGFIYIYATKTLQYITNIAPPDIVCGAEVLATSVDVSNMWLHLVFSDHSLVITDVMDLDNPNITSVSRFHSSCVWDIKTIPDCGGSAVAMRDCFVSCSNDGGARVWKMEDQFCTLRNVINLESVGKGSTDTISPQTHIEARSICIRHDAKHVAIGDRSGNIHVYDLATFERISFISSHDGDILSMDYSHCGTMLASASRDRCIHMFTDGYTPSHTIADHSAAVTAVKFANRDHEYRLMSCGTDKSLYFCAILNSSSKVDISREQHYVEKHSMGDMAIVDDSVLVACGCNLSEYDIFGAKLKRTFRGNEVGSNILRVAVDNQGSLVATSCVDKNIYLLAYTTGDCVSVISGHSEVAVALAFDNNSHIMSASADSCIFVWTVSQRVAEELKQLQKGVLSSESTPGSPDLNKTSYFATNDEFTVEIIEDLPRNIPFDEDLDDPSCINFHSDKDAEQTNTDESFLPTWVTKHLSNDESAMLSNKASPALGKWGDKLQKEKICEEIENLAQLDDLISVVSSCDDRSFELEQYQQENIKNGGANKEISDDLSMTSESLEEDNLQFNATYTKQDFQKLKDEQHKIEQFPTNPPEHDEVKSPCTSDELDDDKRVSENNFAMVSRILNENAALCKKIKQGLKPVAIELQESCGKCEIQPSFEHVDIRALIFNKSPNKQSSENTKHMKSLPHGGTAEDLPLDGAPEKLPLDGTTEDLPLDGATEKSSLVGATEKLPLDGATEKLPLAGATEKLPLDGATEKSSLAGATEKLPLDGATEKSSFDSATEKSPLDSGAKKLPLDEATEKLPQDGAVVHFPHSGKSPHDGAVENTQSNCDSLQDIPPKNVLESVFNRSFLLEASHPKDPVDPDDVELYLASLKLAEEVIQEAESDVSEGTQSTQSDVGSTESSRIELHHNCGELVSSSKEVLCKQESLGFEESDEVTVETHKATPTNEEITDKDIAAKEQTVKDENYITVQGFDADNHSDPTCESDDHVNQTYDVDDHVNQTYDVDDHVNQTCNADDQAKQTCDADDYVNQTSDEDHHVNQTFNADHHVNQTCDADDHANQICNADHHVNQTCDGDDHVNQTCDGDDYTKQTENPQTPTSKKTEIPPAFAELLDSLRKKRVPKLVRSPPKTLPLQKTYNLSVNVDENSSYLTDVENCPSHHETEDHHSKKQQLETNNNYMNGSHDDTSCDKASENLMLVFNRAQAIYHKQKGKYMNQRGIEKLANTFRSIHSQITELNIIADPTPISMDNLSDNSPVVSLLREYSDRLVDIVHTQVEGGKVMTNHPDTV